jgi:hypothetical protein
MVNIMWDFCLPIELPKQLQQIYQKYNETNSNGLSYDDFYEDCINVFSDEKLTAVTKIIKRYNLKQIDEEFWWQVIKQLEIEQIADHLFNEFLAYIAAYMLIEKNDSHHLVFKRLLEWNNAYELDDCRGFYALFLRSIKSYSHQEDFLYETVTSLAEEYSDNEEITILLFALMNISQIFSTGFKVRVFEFALEKFPARSAGGDDWLLEFEAPREMCHFPIIQGWFHLLSPEVAVQLVDYLEENYLTTGELHKISDYIPELKERKKTQKYADSHGLKVDALSDNSDDSKYLFRKVMDDDELDDEWGYLNQNSFIHNGDVTTLAEPQDDYEYLHTGNESYVRSCEKVGRNDPCPCGSGKKYKKCCGQ